VRAKRSTREIFRCAWRDWSEDNASRLAAALAYYTALSLAPLVVLGVVLLKFIGFDGREVIEQQMAMLLGGAGREMAREMIRSAHACEGWLAALVSSAVLIWSASNVFAELQSSMNAIWEVQLRPDLAWRETIRRRFLSETMVFGIGFLLLVSMFVSTALAALAKRIAGDPAAVTVFVDVLGDDGILRRDLQGAARREALLAQRPARRRPRRAAVHDREERARLVPRARLDGVRVRRGGIARRGADLGLLLRRDRGRARG